MKFDLRSKVRVIYCSEVTTWERAFQCIEKMYWHAYGSKMGRLLYADGLTPNEERLTRALVERFSCQDNDVWRRGGEPISVDCGDHTYVFCQVVPFEGPWLPILGIVGSTRE